MNYDKMNLKKDTKRNETYLAWYPWEHGHTLISSFTLNSSKQTAHT